MKRARHYTENFLIRKVPEISFESFERTLKSLYGRVSEALFSLYITEKIVKRFSLREVNTILIKSLKIILQFFLTSARSENLTVAGFRLLLMSF